jgi:hypothetical protein
MVGQLAQLMHYLFTHATYRVTPNLGLGLIRGQHSGRERNALDRTTASP